MTTQQTQQAPVGSTLGTVGAPAYTDEKTTAVAPGQAQAVQVIGVPVGLNPDFAYETDAVKASYTRFVNIPLDGTAKFSPDLSSRGLSEQTFNETILQVKKIKKKSNTNKWLLWPSCIFCCGIIGWLLVDRRSVGNKKLKNHLSPVLEATNMELGNKNVPCRFAWVDGVLRCYYR